MAGPAAAGLAVGRVGREAALVADGSDPDPGDLPEGLLFAPEAAERELCDLVAVRVGTRERIAEDRMESGLDDRLGPTR